MQLPQQSTATAGRRSKEIARKDHLDDVRRSVMVVGELVDILGGEQRYLQRKLERHIKTGVSGQPGVAGFH